MSQRTIYRFGDFLLCPATREFSRGGESLGASTRVFDCLVYLIEHRARAVGRDELGAAVWGRVDVSEAQLTQAILRARRLLGEGSGEPSCIRTIPRFGYHWACEVRVEQIDIEASDVMPAAAAQATRDIDGAETAAAAVTEPALTERAVTEPAVTERAATELSEIDAAATGLSASPVAGSRPAARTRPRRRLLVALVLMAVATALAIHIAGRAPSPPPATAKATAADGIVVLPVDVTADGDHAWVRLGAMDLVAERLRATGLVVVPSETTLALLGNHAATDVRDWSRQTGAAWVVSGRATRSALGWRVSLRANAAAGTEHTASSDGADVLDAFRAASDLLLARLGMNAPAVAPRRDPVLEEIVQRAQAAMLENDLQSAQRMLAAAPESAAAQPELRYQRATLAFRAGRLDEAEQALHGLLDDGSVVADRVLRARLHYGLGAIAMMRDRAAEGESEFEASLQQIDAREHALDYGKALGGRGGARFTLGRVQQGLDDMGQSRVLLEQSGDRLALARMNLTFGIAQLMRDRPGAAVPLLSEAIAQLEPFGAVNERAHAYSALVGAQLALLDYASAEQASTAANVLLARIRDPLNRVETVLDHAALLLTLGRHADAARVFDELDALDLAGHARFDGRRDLLHARRAWALGDAAATLTASAAAVSKLAASEPDSAADAFLLRQRALLALGRRADAESALRDVPVASTATLDGRMPLGLRLARAELAAATGDTAMADREFAAAAADADSRDVPAQRLQVALAWVPHLIRLGRLDAASALIGRLPAAAAQDFNGVLLQVRLHQALGRSRAWADALQRARALAGERAIPPELQTAPIADLPGG